jgi:hypothetical protein
LPKLKNKPSAKEICTPSFESLTLISEENADSFKYRAKMDLNHRFLLTKPGNRNYSYVKKASIVPQNGAAGVQIYRGALAASAPERYDLN